jgi:ribosomal protein S19E (S16A)
VENIAPSGTSNTNYWGGITNAAGISVNGQNNLSISGNIIKQIFQALEITGVLKLQYGL